MTRHILIILFLSISATATTQPMLEQQALLQFAKIKKSEYNWVLAEWKSEMHIKNRSRISSRRSALNNKDPFNPIDRNPINSQDPYYPKYPDYPIKKVQ